MPRPSRTIDEYLATVEPGRRAALQRLRTAILRVVPEAQECISYGMPAFRYRGEVIAGFAATRSGCSFYPFSGRTLDTLGGAVGAYGRTKSALHFDPIQPLPLALLRRLIRTRIAEMER